MTRLVCWLLWAANTSPPYFHSQHFYAMKSVLLRRWAKPDGHDVQHIRDDCFACNGTGRHCEGQSCRRCFGTGAWKEKWYRLDRWRWHGRVFHTPAWEITRRDMQRDATVEGRIRHDEELGRFPMEAALWLALLFDRALWRKLMSSGWHVGWTWYPMHNLRKVYGVTRSKWRRLRGSRCTCGAWHRELFGRRFPRCRRVLAPVNPDDEIPF